MNNELAPINPSPSVPATLGAIDVLGAFLSGRNPRTLQAYSFDLGDFAKFVGAAAARTAVEQLLASAPGHANALALAYRVDMQGWGLATATIARRLAALRSVVKLACTLGRITWALDVEAPHVERRRDTRGPGAGGWLALWEAAKHAGDGPKARRDRALVALMFDLGLRRGECVALNVGAIDPAEGSVAVVGKGRAEAERLTLPEPTRRALASWLETHPDARPEAPLFVRCDPGAVTPDRLTGEAVRRLVAALGKKAGLPRVVRPHGLRHAAITAALDLGHDIRAVRKFSRHKKLETVLLYDDDRRDVAGEIARRVAGDRE